MKKLLIIALLTMGTLAGFSQRLNIRIIQSQSSISEELPNTEEDWPLADSTYRSPIEDGFVGNIRYRSGFIFDDDSVCIIQRTIFITNSMAHVDSLLRSMNFIKIKDGFADSLLQETSGLEIEDEYFGETEECLLRVCMKPDLMVSDDGTVMVYIEFAARYHDDGTEEEKPD